MIEEILYDKLKLISEKLLMLIIKPDIKSNKITDINIDKLISDYNIKGLIIDVDETLRYNMKPISEEVRYFLINIKEKLKVIVLSNGVDYNIKKELNNIGIEYISNSHKPFKSGYIKCLKKLELNPENVIVIGDNIITDILGSKLMNMKNIMITNKK